MNKLRILFIFGVFTLTISCSKIENNKFQLVEGGKIKNKRSEYFGKDTTVKSFRIGKHEITQKEWVEIMEVNPSEIKGDLLPVETVSWYDCIIYCNKRSEKEGLTPYYKVDKSKKDINNDNTLDLVKWIVIPNKNANGYRLPTDLEFEYAAGGGQKSNNYLYSGSNNIDNVAWYWANSGDKKLTGYWTWLAVQGNHCKPKPIGTKAPNELGLYDMSGNVREWCWDWRSNDVEVKGRAWKGGGWAGGEYTCEPIFTRNYTADVKSSDHGFRICRNE
jgi:formylglycine-generating enzyme